LQVTLDADAAARDNLEPGIRTLLFRSVRELLINVGKHAHTDIARVECRRAGGYYVVVVADSGKGFDPQVAFSRSGNRGFGLLSIRERLIGLGGSMDCQSVPGDGSRVTLRVPAAAANYSDEVRS
jgi:signal transduction histidine kinase